jgi:hypothetical protein
VRRFTSINIGFPLSVYQYFAIGEMNEILPFEISSASSIPTI